MRFEERSILKSSKILFPRVEIKFERCFLRTLGPDLPPSCSNHRHRIFATMSTLYRKYVDSGRRATRGSGWRRLTRPSFPPRLSTCPIILGVTDRRNRKGEFVHHRNNEWLAFLVTFRNKNFRISKTLFSRIFKIVLWYFFCVIFSMFPLPLGIEYF